MKIINKILIIAITAIALIYYIPPQIKVMATSNNYLNFQSITTNQGLSHNSINSIYQDHYGYMWFGTALGLNKYDGINFYIYKNSAEIPNSISNSNITAIYETKEKQLWIGTNYGLNKYNRLTDSFTVYLNEVDNPYSLCGNVITSIYEDSSGIIWIGTTNGLCRFDSKKESFNTYKKDPNNENSISSDYITTIIEDSNTNLWVGTINGLNLFDSKSGTFYKYVKNENDNSISNNNITAIFEDSRGNLWIGTATGINLFNYEMKTFTSYLDKKDIIQDTSSEFITSICDDNNGYLWVGTRLGLNRLDVETMDFVNYIPDPENPNSLNTDRITALYKDIEGNIWIGTYYGINKINFNMQVFRYYYQDILNSNAISNIRSIKGSELWLKTRLGPIKFDSETYTILNSFPDIFTNQNYSNSRMNSFCISSDGYLWAGTDGYGLEQFNPITGELIIHEYVADSSNCISSNTILSLYANLTGTVWIGTSKGLCKYDINTHNFTQYMYLTEIPDDIKTGAIWIIYESNKDLWVGTNQCLYKINNTTNEVDCIIDYNNFGGIYTNNIVRTLFEDSRGILWIVTGNGLFCYDIKNNVFILHGLEEMLVKDLIRDVIEDNNGDIWISTGGDGLWRLSEKEKTITKFGIDDGLESDFFLFRSSYKANSGELFFGTIIGLISFFPQLTVIDTNIPKIVINKFSLLEGTINLDSPVEEKKELNLSYFDNSFEIDFVALSYDYPQYNQYAYMLEGFDKVWSYCNASESFTKYTNIPNGEYTFKVIASNSDGIWNYEGVSLKIIISPPFWKEWWFILTLIALALMSVIVAIKFRTYSLNKYAQTLETQVEERTIELNEKNKHIEEQLNNKMRYTRALVHELKTPLTPLLASSDFLCSELEDKIPLRFAKNINEGALNLSKRIDELLDLAKSETGMIDIKPKPVDLTYLIKNTVDYIKPEISKKGLNFNSLVPHNIPKVNADEERIRQVILNLLDNAIKYTQIDGHITLKVFEKDNGIVIQIKDTGIGIDEKETEYLFEPYHRLESGLIRTGGMGLGLFISKTIVELHGGHISVKSQKGIGSTFNVWLPIG